MRRGAAALAAVALAGCGGDDLGGDFGTYTDCAHVGRLDTVTDPSGDAGGGPGSADLVAASLAQGEGRLCARFETRAAAESGSAFVLELRPEGDPAGPLVALTVAILAGQEPEVLVRSTDAGEAGRLLEDATVGSDGTRLSLALPLGALAGATDRAVAETPAWSVRVISTDGEERWTDQAPDAGPA